MVPWAQVKCLSTLSVIQLYRLALAFMVLYDAILAMKFYYFAYIDDRIEKQGEQTKCYVIISTISRRLPSDREFFPSAKSLFQLNFLS